MDFFVLANHRVKINESEKINKDFDIARELKKQKKKMEHESYGYNSYNSCTWNGLQRIGTVRNQRMHLDNLDYSIDEIGQNTEKSPGNLWIFAVTQNLVKDYQLKLVRKTRIERK